MSAQLFESIGHTTSQSDKALHVSFRLILALYAIIPICLVLQVCDQFFWDAYLRQSLPSSPNHFLLFQILFGTPHILASNLIVFGNRDYRQCYWRKLVAASLIFGIVFGLGNLFLSQLLLYVAVASWTVLHVLKQQYGLSRGVCRYPGWVSSVLLSLSVVAGLAIYLGIFLKNNLTPEHAVWVRHIAASACALLLLAALLMQRYVASGVGKVFYWANILLVLASFYLYANQYYLLAILAPRLVHDLTAYSVYIAHDYNRHHHTPQNALYRLARQWHLPTVVVLPLLSFVLAFCLQSYGDQWVNWAATTLFGTEFHQAVSIGILGYFALMHYYTEGFLWKQGSPLRRYLVFAKF